MQVNSISALSSSVTQLQETRRDTKTNNISRANDLLNQKNNAIRDTFKQQVDARAETVSDQVQATNSKKASLKVDISVGDDPKESSSNIGNQLSNVSREAPLASFGQKNQRPGSVVDLSV